MHILLHVYKMVAARNGWKKVVEECVDLGQSVDAMDSVGVVLLQFRNVDIRAAVSLLRSFLNLFSEYRCVKGRD